MIFLNYITRFFKSLFTTKIGGRDLLLIGVIAFMVFKLQYCNNPGPNTHTTTPALAVVEKTKAKDGTTQTVVPVTVLTKKEMKEATKPIKKNLGLDEVTSVDTIVTGIDVKTDTIPVVEDSTNNTVSTTYETKDIVIKHLYDVINKTGQFNLHITPDTATYVHGVKTHWLKADEHTLRVQHTNDLFNDTLAASYTYKEPKPWLVIGPSVGASINYTDNKWKVSPMVGVTATFPLLTLKRKK